MSVPIKLYLQKQVIHPVKLLFTETNRGPTGHCLPTPGLGYQNSSGSTIFLPSCGSVPCVVTS